MFIYFLISILVKYRSAEALPIGLAYRADTTQDMTSPLQLRRTLFGVIWSCTSTTIICAWTSVHPNVPPPSKWKARWNRLWIMFWMIVAPELVLAWAVRQLYAARQIRDEYNRSRPELPKWMKWTLAHGHMVGMGGFISVDPEDEYKDPDEQGGKDPEFKFPTITDADIHDRSKGDTLWKIIAMLQTTWFIVQCIARGQQGLALTELELVTLALASLNVMTFAIWWHKPLGVAEPLKIYLKTEARRIIEDTDRRDDRRFNLYYSLDVIRKGWAIIKRFAADILRFFQDPRAFGLVDLFIGLPIFLTYTITFPVFVLFPLGIILLLGVIKTKPPVPRESPQSRGLLAVRIVVSLQRFLHKMSSAVGEFVGGWLKEIFSDTDLKFVLFLYGWFFLLPSLFVLLLLFLVFLIPFLTLLLLVSFIFAAVFGIVTTSSVIPGASHVPSFYAPTTTSDRWSRMVVFALFGVIFGGLHCIGWYFKYPTHSEQTLWRATSLAITVIPLVVAPIDFLLDINSGGMAERTALLILDLIMTVLLFIYVPARLSLILQALALLRNQPSSALLAVDWTQYIPHIFS